MVRWVFADHGVLRGVSASRLLYLGLLPLARLVGRRDVVPSILREWASVPGREWLLRTGLVGALLTLVVAIFGSLWPAIALHALDDLGFEVMAWAGLRDGSTSGDVMKGERLTEPQSAPGVESSPTQAEPGAAPDRGV